MYGGKKAPMTEDEVASLWRDMHAESL